MIVNYFEAIFFFFLGGIFASFLNLCVYRLEKENSFGSILVGRSSCENCKKTLQPYELIPILSFLFLLGKCTKCGSKINSFNLFSELLLGLSFVVFWYFELPVSFFIFLLIIYFFASYDFNFKGIPKNITNMIFSLSFIYWLFLLLSDFNINRVYSVILFLFLFALLQIATLFVKKTLFGLGDVIVIAILALWFELVFFLNILILSFIWGGFCGLILVILNKKYFKKYIPFLPFVLLGFLTASLFYYSDILLFDYILAIW